MATLYERREAKIKLQEEELKKANKKYKSEHAVEARKLRNELDPRMFVNIEELTEELLKTGHMDVSSSYFTMSPDTEYFNKVSDFTSEGLLLGRLLDSKVVLTCRTDAPRLSEILARDGYILEDIADYLAEHDIGIITNGYGVINPFKLFILEG